MDEDGRDEKDEFRMQVDKGKNKKEKRKVEKSGIERVSNTEKAENTQQMPAECLLCPLVPCYFFISCWGGTHFDGGSLFCYYGPLSLSLCTVLVLHLHPMSFLCVLLNLCVHKSSAC